MTKNLDSLGLKSVADQYDLFFIVLWGVVHNGVKLYQESVEVLGKLLEINKELVLLTNAPRPNHNVEEFLKRMGLEKKFYSKVYTSGEAALNYLKTNFKYKTFFHLGPPRDFGLFENFKKNKVQKISQADYLLCTGLFDEQDKELSYYKKLLETSERPVIIISSQLLNVNSENRLYVLKDVAETLKSFRIPIFCSGGCRGLLGDKKWKYELDNDYYNNRNHSATPITQKKTVIKR